MYAWTYQLQEDRLSVLTVVNRVNRSPVNRVNRSPSSLPLRHSPSSLSSFLRPPSSAQAAKKRGAAVSTAVMPTCGGQHGDTL